MFWETLRNEMLRKISIHTYPNKSYLPIFDRSKLECNSLLRMRRNKFCIMQRSPYCRNFEKTKHLKCPMLCTQALYANLNSSNSQIISL